MVTFPRLCAAMILFAVIATVQASSAQPFGIEVHGNFKRMSHTGDTSGKVALTALNAGSDMYGVGALSGLRGEVMIWGGRVLVTRGHAVDGAVSAGRDDDEATLLVTAKVIGWHEVEVPDDMDQKAFEAFVLQSARSRGLSAAKPFPFAVRGEFSLVKWHVVTAAAAARDSGHGSGAAHAKQHAHSRVFDEPRARGVMLGFYSGDSLEGVISHPGERFHLHYADADFTRSGHADRFAVARGAVLLLPK